MSFLLFGIYRIGFSGYPWAALSALIGFPIVHNCLGDFAEQSSLGMTDLMQLK